MLIRDVLSKRRPREIENRDSRYREGAVLVPFLLDQGEYKVLFTKRTDHMEDHQGQISFPGGSVDEKDRTYQDTALRETYEEVGVHPEDVTILGRMDDALTMSSNFLVHPFVGYVPYPYAFAVNAREVKRLIVAPLKVFLPGSPSSRRDTVEYRGVAYESRTYHYRGDIIWGATARIMEKLVDILGEKIDLIVKRQ